MTVAEQIKRSTEFNSARRIITCYIHAVRVKTALYTRDVGCGEFTFIDGSKLTCRVYW
jgi:hypothetical protein